MKPASNPSESWSCEHPDPGQHPESIDLLRNLPLFADLPDRCLERMRERTVLRQFDAGEILIKAGTSHDALTILRSGRVKVVHQRLGYNQQVIKDIHPGRPLTLMPVLDGLPCPCTIVGVTAGDYLHLPGDTVREILEEYPRVALRMLHCMAQRFRTFTRLLGTLSMLNLEERLAAFVLQNAPVVGDPPDPTRHWDLNHEELGQRIGGSREEITRLLSKLKKAGLIQVGRRRVEILDKPGLRRLTPELPELWIS